MILAAVLVILVHFIPLYFRTSSQTCTASAQKRSTKKEKENLVIDCFREILFNVHIFHGENG